MKQLRKTIFWCHLLAGTIAGIIILIMSVTGVLLTYERQIVAWADARSSYNAAPSAAGAARLSVETLLAKVGETQSQQQQQQAVVASSITLRATPDAPAIVSFAGGRTIYVNSYTGEVLGEGSKKTRAFFRSVTD